MTTEATKWALKRQGLSTKVTSKLSETKVKYGISGDSADHVVAQFRASRFASGPRSMRMVRTRFGYVCESPRNRFRRADGSLAERVLHAAWRRAGFRGASVRGRDGHQYRVLYSGRPASGYGPDFRDAVMERDDGVRVHGDIELHVRSSEWKAHGHGSDSQYNGVVFHVASVDDTPDVETLSGIRIPLLVLDQRFTLSKNVTRATPPASLPITQMNLAEAGLKRFRNRSHGLRLAIEAMGRDQALWEAALETLGYPSNRQGFIQLAHRLDWTTVSTLALTRQRDELQKIFIWAAGLGPRPESAPSLKARPPKWRSVHGRPANRPLNRIGAAVSWALMWRESGPAESIARAVRSAQTASELSRMLRGDSQRPSLGVSRARDTVVNVALPAAHALAEIEGSRSAARRAIKLYESHPKTQRNSIESEAAMLLKSRGFSHETGNACEQQGLIHIYREMTRPTAPETQLSLL